jgi:dTDP-4-dehydrorhamnose reductase
VKIHVLGSTGMLGGYVVKFLTKCGYSVISYNRNDLDVFNFKLEWFEKKVSSSDIVINCIGVLKPNIYSYEQAIVVNRDFPLILDFLSRNIGYKLINFSSDCVYTGLKGRYIETDRCDATDFYGITKDHNQLKSTVMRVSFIGEERYNKIGILEYARQNRGRDILGYSNCMWNGLTGLEISKIIDRMIRGEICFWSGVRHVFSNRSISKLELLELINKIYKLDLKIHNHIATGISGTPINGVLDRTLSTIHAPLHIPTIEEMIIEQKQFMK